jgi:Leucine-rich repeat (LRR) protein
MRNLRATLLGIASLWAWGHTALAQPEMELSTLFPKATWVYDKPAKASARKDTVLMLRLYDHDLRAIPEWVYECKQLVALHLTNTSITHLPARLNELKQLRSVIWQGEVAYRDQIAAPGLGYSAEMMKKMTSASPKERKAIVDSLAIISKAYREQNEEKWRKMEAARPATPLTFDRLENITYLDISNHKLAKLPTSIKNLVNLEEIILNKNLLTEVPRPLQRLTNLRRLYLNQNGIALKKQGLRPLRKLTSLERLGLAYNRIGMVPKSIRHVSPTLTDLILSGNPISEVSPELARLQGLRNLQFYANKLRAIPEGVFALKNLEELDIYKNEIRVIPPQIKQLANLKILYASYNKLTELPDEIGELAQLRGLYVHHNQITYINPAVGKLAKLELFHAQGNRLAAFPAMLPNLPLLREINLGSNVIGDLPATVSQLRNLRFLHINGNALSSELTSAPDFVQMVNALREREVNFSY